MTHPLLTGAALALALAASSAMAQPAPGGGPPPGGGNPAFAAVRAACQADGDKLCAGKQGRERFQCMRENSDKLSAECKDAMSKLPQRPPGAAPGGGGR
jgi:hypothetical protein